MARYNIFFWIRIVLILLICTCYFYCTLYNNQPPNTGDGLIHFFISQASWSDPILFLNHWGKPLFTLFSSPFSQFGYEGIVVFNCVVFSLTIIISWKIFDYYNINKAISIVFPCILFSIPDINETILSGLTEPFFNLVLILSVYFFIKEKYLFFSLLVSTIPFCRSEGQLVVLLAMPILVLLKQYKAILFLGVGFLVYAIFGSIFLNDFFWYFNDSPYKMDNNIYGSGDWLHYLKSYPQYIGEPGLIVFILGLISYIIISIKKTRIQLKFPLVFFSISTFLGILFCHSYFWATGQNGSLGLTRIATQGMPLFLIICIIYIGKIKISNHILFSTISIFLSSLLMLINIQKNTKIIEPKDLDKAIHETANFIKEKPHRIQYYHPLLAFILNVNPFNKKTKSNLIRNESSSSLSKQIEELYKPRDLIIRDSHFGRHEALLPLRDLEKEPSLVLIEEFPSEAQIDDPENSIEGVRIYQYLPDQNDHIPIHRSKESIKTNATLTLNKDDLYKGLIDTICGKGTYFETSIISSTDKVKLALEIGEGKKIQYYTPQINIPLKQKFASSKKSHIKYYIWNPNKVEALIKIKKTQNKGPKKFKIKFH